MIWIVTGGRNYRDEQHVQLMLDNRNAQEQITFIVTGACQLRNKDGEPIPSGADAFAEYWARDREVPYWGIPAKFRTGTHGGREGPIRNALMVTEAVLLSHHMHERISAMAFPGGAGTASCITIARQAGVTVFPCCDAHPLPEPR